MGRHSSTSGDPPGNNGVMRRGYPIAGTESVGHTIAVMQHRQVGSVPLWLKAVSVQSPRFSGSLVVALPPRLSGFLRLTAPGCTLIPLGS